MQSRGEAHRASSKSDGSPPGVLAALWLPTAHVENCCHLRGANDHATGLSIEWLHLPLTLVHLHTTTPHDIAPSRTCRTFAATAMDQSTTMQTQGHCMQVTAGKVNALRGVLVAAFPCFVAVRRDGLADPLHDPLANLHASIESTLSLEKGGTSLWPPSLEL